MSLPPSSPRLPSPPPPAEIQIGPKSPLMGPNATRQAAQIEQTAIDTNAKRRTHPGTKSADMAAGPPLVPLHELDSAFQLQEHLAALHYYHTASHTTPVTRETAKLLATPPPGIDRTLWLYELCRFLIAQCNTLIVGFLFDTPPCSATTCPEMRAGEWQFLCAVHDTPKSCCAIDYCCHTLDWAANVVTNPKIFPSRFVVDPHDKHTASKSLTNVFRRLHRIFAHAWFQHRGVFWSVESQSGLYVFFKTVCDVYDLLPAENYKLPPEAEGLESSSTAADSGDRTTDRKQPHHQQQFAPISIAKPPSQRDAEDGDYSSMSRTNTRRHIKSSPSVGSAVTTVPEADEDESADLSHRLSGMRISVPINAAGGGGGGDTAELTSIPVIVDHRPVSVAEQPLRPSSVIPPPPRAAATTTNERQPEAAANESTSGAAEPVVSEAEFASEPEIPPPAEPEVNPASAPEPEAEIAPESEATEPASTAPAEAQQEREGFPPAASEEKAEETVETHHQEAPPAATTSHDAGSEHQSTAAAAAESDADAEKDTDAGGKAEEEVPTESVAREGEVSPATAQPASEPQAATDEGTEAEIATAGEVSAEEKSETGESEVASEEKTETEQTEDKGGEEHKEEGNEAEQEK